MERQVVRRRVKTIAGHFASNDDISTTATHIFPMNCNNRLNSVIRRYDNRMNFARQGSCSQACFMRQTSVEQNCNNRLNSVIRRYDNRMNFARQGSCSQACFMRQTSVEQGSYSVPNVSVKCTSYANHHFSTGPEAPLFSRPARVEDYTPNIGVIQDVVQDCKLCEPTAEPPNFARPNRHTNGQEQFYSKKSMQSFAGNGFEWSPKMDVGESGCNYILTVELPGVNINDMRVEVTEQNLIVMGNRSTKWWKVTACSNDSFSSYHKREILEGPYQVVWPLPTNVNNDQISADFVDGFLQIRVPKI